MDSFGRTEALGGRIADQVASVVGSWTFLIIQTLCLVAWMIVNVLWDKAWDPYPFILMNVLLSFQAAYAGPVILMSQNRQEDLDRLRATDLHEKVDHIRLDQMIAIWDQLKLLNQRLEASKPVHVQSQI